MEGQGARGRKQKAAKNGKYIWRGNIYISVHCVSSLSVLVVASQRKIEMMSVMPAVASVTALV